MVDTLPVLLLARMLGVGTLVNLTATFLAWLP